MVKVTKRMDWLEDQIKIQEDALVTCSNANVPVHSYLLRRLSDEWCMRTKRGEVSSYTYALGGEVDAN